MSRSGILLSISLLFNVFAAGALSGGIIMLTHEHGRPLLRPVRLAGEQLPPSDRRAFHALIAATLRDNRALARQEIQARARAAFLFRQPDFDRAAAEAALADARDAVQRFQAAIDTAAIAFASGLPADERVTLAAGLERGGPLRHPGVTPPARAP